MRRFALLLGIALSLTITSAVGQSCDGFTDVSASSPFCPDVTWITSYGITKGCGGSQFCPNENVTRLQMAAFMHRLGGDVFLQNGNAFGVRAALGTNDNYPVVVFVDAQRAMLLQPTVDSFYGFNPNVVNGMFQNAAAGGVAGATIAGGGGCNPGTGGACSSAYGNQVTGVFGTVGGGLGNSAGASDTVAGGAGNMASGGSSSVAGGASNTASAGYSAVAGGFGNTASGGYSTVAGGAYNTASGEGSFAVGEYANAANNGCFVFSDASGTTTTDCDAPNAFVARAEGGFFLITSGVNGTYAGAVLSTGSGSWTTFSDRAAKSHVLPVDPQEVLAHLTAMPLSTWNYNAQAPSIRHMGPMAQDFYSAFALGETDKGISVVDAQGVAFAAIQGLSAKVDEQNTRLESALREKSRQMEEQAATIVEQQREITGLIERVQKAEFLAADVVTLKAALAELQRERENVAVKEARAE
jgi:hypothetical protein